MRIQFNLVIEWNSLSINSINGGTIHNSLDIFKKYRNCTIFGPFRSIMTLFDKSPLDPKYLTDKICLNTFLLFKHLN
jgi:hypothetical protein